MKTELNLSQMTFAEKLGIVDEIWGDICRSPESVESPVWHNDILKERKTRVESGEERVLDWDEAERLLNEEIQG